MKLSTDDKFLLQELCVQNEVNYEKVTKLLDVVQEYELKDRRTGVYDALRDVLSSLPSLEVSYEI